jgi:hypothetical protein
MEASHFFIDSHAVSLAAAAGLAEEWTVFQAWVREQCIETQEVVSQLPLLAVIMLASAAVLAAAVNLTLLVLWLRARKCSKSPAAPRSADVSAPPVPESPSQEEDSDAELVGVPIQTLIGTLVFPTTHAVGKVGDNLTALYFTGLGYTKKKSKTSKVHGIDGVYVRYSPASRSCWEIIVVENKINTSGYKPHQLSLDGIESQCDRMLRSEDTEVHETAELILEMMSGANRDRLARVLVRHDLRTGRSTRTAVDRDGHVLDKQGQWKNERHMTMVLRNAVKKGRAQEVQQPGSSQ